MKLKQACKIYGDYGINISADDYIDSGLPMIRTSDMDDFGNVILSDAKSVEPTRAGGKILSRGDLLFSRAGTIGRCMLFDTDEGATFAAYLVRFRCDLGKLYPSFAKYWAQSHHYWNQVKVETIESTIGNFNASKFSALHLPEVDVRTQKRIASFLDREIGRIDDLIGKKERMIKVMREGLLSKLEQLVTPDSPSHRQMIPFRWVCRISEGQVDPTAQEWCDKPLIAPNHIEPRTGRLIAIETAQDQGAISGKYAFSSGTVLYSKIRPNLAKACVSSVEGMCSADMYPILPDKRLLPQFLVMQLLSEKFTDWATLESMRVAMPKINRETLGSYRLWVPALDIQEKAGAAFVAAQAQNEALADMVAQSVDRLREYRAALITAAVTGQIDVDTYDRAGKTSATLDRIEEEMQA